MPKLRNTSKKRVTKKRNTRKTSKKRNTRKNKKTSKKRKTKRGERKEVEKKYIYRTSGEYLDKDIIKALEKRSNWVKSDDKDDKVDYLYIDGFYRYKDLLYKYPESELLNINDEIKNYQIANKNFLFENMKIKYPEIYKKYFPEQYNINLNTIDITSFKKIIGNNTWFLKPVYGFRSSGIIVFDNFNSFKDSIENLKKKFDCSNEDIWKKNCNYIISKDIKPMLFKNKKFHFRVYFICTNINDKKNFYIFDRFEIFTAKNKYDPNKIKDPNIWDSSRKNTDNNYHFPDDYEKNLKKIKCNNCKTLINDIKYLFKHVKELVTNKCHLKSKNCYEIYGADIMVSEDGQLKILEINSRTGYKNLDKKMKHILVEGQLQLTLDKLFPPKNKPKKETHFIEI